MGRSLLRGFSSTVPECVSLKGKILDFQHSGMGRAPLPLKGLLVIIMIFSFTVLYWYIPSRVYTDISLPGLYIIYIAFPGLCMLMYRFSASLLLYGVFSYYTGYSPIIRGVIPFHSLGEQKEKGSATQEKNLL